MPETVESWCGWIDRRPKRKLVGRGFGLVPWWIGFQLCDASRWFAGVATPDTNAPDWTVIALANADGTCAAAAIAQSQLIIAKRRIPVCSRLRFSAGSNPKRASGPPSSSSPRQRPASRACIAYGTRPLRASLQGMIRMPPCNEKPECLRGRSFPGNRRPAATPSVGNSRRVVLCKGCRWWVTMSCRASSGFQLPVLLAGPNEVLALPSSETLLAASQPLAHIHAPKSGEPPMETLSRTLTPVERA